MANVIKKLIVGILVGGVLVGVTRALEFPPVFQAMFFAYAMLGAAVFILLDAPSLKPISGTKAVTALVVFYIVISAVYIAGASFLPQYDPEDEKGKIAKILESKRRQTEQGKAEELIARAKVLEEQAKAISERLKSLSKDVPEVAVGVGPDSVKPTPASIGGAMDAKALEQLGFEQWQLQECYNCHKLRGEGGKKRGPELDNIGSYLTAEEIKQKILDPKSWMAEGFEKEYEKGKMPDKYKDLMEEKDVEVLAAWLATMKNPSVNTPKPVKKK
ncbi:MAG: cytochrome c [Nitrospirota bacterium]